MLMKVVKVESDAEEATRVEVILMLQDSGTSVLQLLVEEKLAKGIMLDQCKGVSVL